MLQSGAMSRDDSHPTDPNEVDADSGEDRQKIRLPSKLEVAEAVESTPTVEDGQKPNMELPDYLAPSARTIELNIDESVDEETAPTERMEPLPGFTERVSNVPTEREIPAASLSSEVIERPAASDEAKSFPWMLVGAVVVVAIVGAVLALS